jgi:hypothetical protein
MNSLFRQPPGATKSTENPLLLKIPPEHRENHSQEDFTNRMLERNHAITQEGVLLCPPLSDDSTCRRFHQKIHRKENTLPGTERRRDSCSGRRSEPGR